MTLRFYQTGFIKTLWFSIPINGVKVGFQADLVSNNVTIRNSKEEKVPDNE